MNSNDHSDADDNPGRASPRRPIRSFVRREGRLTPAQARAIDALWPVYGVDYDGKPLDLPGLFGRDAPRTLEIGFGNGASLATLAARHPERDFLGIEVHRPGVGQLLAAIGRAKLGNVRVLCHDAVEVLTNSLPAGCLDRVLLFFPDPWPKKRHHKRRIVQPGFVDLVARCLAPGGSLHVATDWEAYAAHIHATLAAHPAFTNSARGDDYRTGAVARPASRPVTRFEMRGRRLGHGVWDYLFVRTQGRPLSS